MTKDLTEVETVARALARCALERIQAADSSFFKMKYPGGVDEYCALEWPKYSRDAIAAIAAHRAHLSASGYVIVPAEPTEAMVKAGEAAFDLWEGDGDEYLHKTAVEAIWHGALSALSPKAE